MAIFGPKNQDTPKTIDERFETLEKMIKEQGKVIEELKVLVNDSNKRSIGSQKIVEECLKEDCPYKSKHTVSSA